MTPPTSRLYLPDTNILVHHARNDAIYQRIESQYSLLTNNDAPLLCVITLGEIRSLARQNRWRAAKQQKVEEFISHCTVVQLNAPGLIDAYVEIKYESIYIGRRMGDHDLWIAATARVTGATLLTTDKDFDHLHPALLKREWIDPNTP